MPETRTYIVTRTQQVKVTANNHTDAEALAIAALDNHLNPPAVFGRVDGAHGLGTREGAARFVEASTVSVESRRVLP